MTDQQKLQQLFAAALKDCSDPEKPPTRLFVLPAAVPEPAPEVALAPEPILEIPSPAEPVVNAGLSDAESKELGALLDESQRRKSARHRRQALGTLGVMVALVGGGVGWFVQSPQRMQAFGEAIHDIRSIGDVTAMAAKYQVALDKIATRSNHIDEATKSMGVSADQAQAEDPNMEAEMRTLMGSEGKTTGERNQLVRQKLSKVKDKLVTTSPDAVKEGL